MSLPIVKTPTFSVKIKEFKKPLSIRPMVVSEHKALQHAMDIGSDIDLMNTISDVVTACVDNAVDAKKVERHILDFIFLQLYMTSVENVVTSRYVCKNHLKNEDGSPKIDEETGDEIICNTPIDVKIPLERVAIKYPDDYDSLKVISIGENLKMHMKSLSLADTIDIENIRQEIYTLADELTNLSDKKEKDKDDTSNDARIEELQKQITKMNDDMQTMYVYHSILKIVDGENEMTPSTDFTIKEFTEWFGTLPSKVNGDIDKFIALQPSVALDIKITCIKCLNSRDMSLRGLQDFFS